VFVPRACEATVARHTRTLGEAGNGRSRSPVELGRFEARHCMTAGMFVSRLLVLDPFVRLHRVNENQSGDVAAVLGYLRELQHTDDVAIAVFHHARKNGGSTGGLRLRGSGDFFAWVDAALSLRRRHQLVVLSVEYAPPRRSTPSRSPRRHRFGHASGHHGRPVERGDGDDGGSPRASGSYAGRIWRWATSPGSPSAPTRPRTVHDTIAHNLSVG
jgi:hypothetical protein